MGMAAHLRKYLPKEQSKRCPRPKRPDHRNPPARKEAAEAVGSLQSGARSLGSSYIWS